MRKINDGLTNEQRFRMRHPQSNHEYYQNHPELRELTLKYYYNHKTWISRNCEICGKFCPKESRKYCSYCREMMKILISLFDRTKLYHRNSRARYQ